MSAIVDFPRVVGDELERFADLFANAPQRLLFTSGSCLPHREPYDLASAFVATSWPLAAS